MKKLTFLVLAALSWSACKQSTGTENKITNNETATVSAIDSVNTAFDEAWNKKDSAAVVSMLADDIIMISGKSILKGKEELAKNFVGRQMPVAGNLKVKKERVDASGNLGYETGTWSLQVSLPGKTPFEQTGNYNFVWKKDADKNWKVSVINMEDHDLAKP
jgi:ketosteroid isomerase-like protein